MLDLTETPESSTGGVFDPFYTHDDGTHWVHSSLYTDDPDVDCWFTPDALVMWYPDVFEYDLKTPISPLLNFPTFKPRNTEGTLPDYAGVSWVVCPGYRDSHLEQFAVAGYVYVNNWGTPNDCIREFKRSLERNLEMCGVLP